MFKRPLACAFALAVLALALVGPGSAEAGDGTWIPIFGDFIVCSVDGGDTVFVAPPELRSELEVFVGGPSTVTPFFEAVDQAFGAHEIHVVEGYAVEDGLMHLEMSGFLPVETVPTPLGDAMVYSR